MKILSLIHQTRVEVVESILSQGFKLQLKTPRLVDAWDDYERLLWFDFIGKYKQKIVTSSGGNVYQVPKGVTFVFDFQKLLKKIKTMENYCILFVNDYIKFEPYTYSITLWSSDNITLKNIKNNLKLPDKVRKSVECVVSTYTLDEPPPLDIKDCIKKIIVYHEDHAELKRVLEKLNLDIPVTVLRKFTKEDIAYIKSECNKNSSLIKNFKPEYKHYSVSQVCADLFAQIYMDSCLDCDE